MKLQLFRGKRGERAVDRRVNGIALFLYGELCYTTAFKSGFLSVCSKVEIVRLHRPLSPKTLN